MKNPSECLVLQQFHNVVYAILLERFANTL
jgi:hypothetical protein